MHFLPPLHTLPHDPQFCASTLRSMHAIPHAMKPSVHMKSQRPFLHTGCECGTPAMHFVSQSPQCIASVIVSVQEPLQSVGVSVGQPETQVPEEHIGVLSPHSTPHLPQFVGSVMSVSQPSSGSLEQCAQPFAHELGLIVQVPFEHVAGPATFGNAVQSWPHSPQLRLSFGTHVPSQLNWLDEHVSAAPPSAAEAMLIPAVFIAAPLRPAPLRLAPLLSAPRPASPESPAASSLAPVRAAAPDPLPALLPLFLPLAFGEPVV